MSLLARAKRQGPGALVLALLAAAALATVALAYVTVYSNSFASKRDYRQVERVGGGSRSCKREWVQKREIMRIQVGKAPAVCTYRPPVQGDGAHPDHRFDADGRILKDTKAKVRKHAYLSLAIRVGGGRRYLMRVFPKRQRYEMRRQPTGPGFPDNGNEPAIGKLGQLNKLRLVADGDHIRGFVNGAEVADITDPNASQLTGTKLEFSVGNKANSKKNTIGVFDKLKLAVPNP